MKVMKLSKFSAQKLFGYLNVKIPIANNKLIIVAENGAGKTTILRLMYLFLSKQWNRLIEYDFEKISATINDRSYHFQKSSFEDTYVPSTVIEQAISDYPIYEDFIRNELTKHKVQELLNDPFLTGELETKYDVPVSMIFTILERISKFEFDADKYDWEINVLYLPTYRRIERNFEDLYADLDRRLGQYIRQLFPLIERQIEYEKQISEEAYSETEIDISNIFETLWRARDFERWDNSLAKPMHMELIEFGMEDVQFRLSEALGKGEEYQKSIKLYLETCNRYLNDHKEISITKSGKYFTIYSTTTKQQLPLSVLSSGEKQILSLFSYFLIQPSKTFIIIDEPELSLSLRWQETLIEDILSFRVSGIVTATHSPFIVSNAVKSLTRGINEFYD